MYRNTLYPNSFSFEEYTQDGGSECDPKPPEAISS